MGVRVLLPFKLVCYVLGMIIYLVVKFNALIIRLLWLVSKALYGGPEFLGTRITFCQMFLPFCFLMFIYKFVDVSV